jgi:hypothetical protein
MEQAFGDCHSTSDQVKRLAIARALRELANQIEQTRSYRPYQLAGGGNPAIAGLPKTITISLKRYTVDKDSAWDNLPDAYWRATAAVINEEPQTIEDLS